MIASMEYIKPLHGWCPLECDAPAQIPLYSDVTDGEQQRLVKLELLLGKVLYLAYSSHEMLVRYVQSCTYECYASRILTDCREKN